MVDIIRGIDILGLGVLLGDILLLAALVWVLVDDRSCADTAPSHQRQSGASRPRSRPGASAPGDDKDGDRPNSGSPTRSPGRRRAA